MSMEKIISSITSRWLGAPTITKSGLRWAFVSTILAISSRLFFPYLSLLHSRRLSHVLPFLCLVHHSPAQKRIGTLLILFLVVCDGA